MRNSFLPDSGDSGVVRRIITPARRSDEVIAAQWAVCEPCKWNIGNKCQHPQQGCAPCKQGTGLSEAISRVDFRCPIS